MRFSGETDLPAALVDAHATGQLVIFVGAGASMPEPSLLPSFSGLVKKIRDESNLAEVFTDEILEQSPLDEVLGRIQDEHDVDVHQRVSELVSREGSRPSPLHEAIANLAVASTVRVITTNYDLHLSTLLRNRDVVDYQAPALPLGDDFTGLAYVHGRLDQEPRHLIATDEDFGKAYLTDAWAARFLGGVFREYSVLFVGYSHSDTIMKYLARGLGGRSKGRYALTETDDSRWRQLGITAIRCPRDDQPTVLNSWAAIRAEGLLGTRDRVKRLVAEQKPSPIPEESSFLERVIADKETVKFFGEFASGEAWLRWIVGRPEFATLFSPSSHVDVDEEITAALAFWFAEKYVNDEGESDTAFQNAVNAGGHLGDHLVFAVSRQLAQQQLPLSERMRRWLIIITNSREHRLKAPLLGALLNGDALSTDPATALYLFDYLLEPRILPYDSYFQSFGHWFEPTMRDRDMSLGNIWVQAFQPHLERFSCELIDIADRHLRRADLQLAIASDSDRDRPSTWRSLIDIDDQDVTSPLGLLVDVARDCLEVMLASGSPVAGARLGMWQASGVELLQRLALYGWKIRSDKTSTEKIEWLVTSGWLHDRRLTADANSLITEVCASADDDAIGTLVGDIRQHWEDNAHSPRRAYDLLKLIDQATTS